MFVPAIALFVLVSGALAARECPADIQEHAKDFVENVCEKFGGIEDFKEFVQCKKDVGYDLKAGFVKCAKELEIEDPENIDVAYQHVCKQESVEKRLEAACCTAIETEGLVGGGQQKQADQDKKCWKKYKA